MVKRYLGISLAEIISICAAALILLSVQNGCSDSKQLITVSGPGVTKVIQEAKGSHYQNVNVIAELTIGDTVEVLGYRYLKDCMIYEVVLKDGEKGWITHGDNCKLVEPS